MSNGVRYTPTFALPSEYEQQAMEARRRRRMAEMLAQQAYQPQDVGVAPIPKAAPLVQGLQAFLSERQARKAEEAEEKARKADVQSVSDLLKQLSPQERSGAEAAIAEMAQTAQPGRINADGTYTPSTITPGTAEIGMPYTEAAPTGQARQDILLQAQFGGSPRAADLAKALMAQQPEREEFGTTPQYDAQGRAFVLGKGGNVRYLEGITKAPEQEKLPTSVQEYEYAKGQGFQGTLADWERQNRAASAPRITIDKGGELAQELFLKDLAQQNTAVRGAEGIINKLDQMTASTAKGTFTGGLAPGAVGAAQFLQTFGINVDPNTVANTRAFQAASNQLVLDFMSANGGARGFTEKETAILQDAFPKIVDSPQARMQITTLLRNRAQETINNYNQTLDQYKTTYPSSVIPFRKVETEDDRYQRWLKQQGRPQ